MKKKLCIYFLLTFTFIVITNIGYKIVLGLELHDKNNIDSYILRENQINYNENKLKDGTLTDVKSFTQSNDVVEVFNSSTKKVYLTESDINLMAKVVFAESNGEPYTGKIAVASVILNRVISPNFPNTIKEVITQKNAFSCVVNGNINVTPNSDSYNAVMDAIQGSDPTNKALYFYNPKIATCSWMKQIEKCNVKTIGQHVFFNIK